MEIKNDDKCFCCGNSNERGLKLKFEYSSNGEAKSSLIIPEYFAGWQRLCHGGFLVMLLDEIMAHAIMAKYAPAKPDGDLDLNNPSYIPSVTGEITASYKKPNYIGSKINIVGRIESERGRVINTIGQIFNDQGELTVSAKAIFIQVKKK